MPRAELGYEALHKVNPRLFYARLSGLGYDGPYARRGGFRLGRFVVKDFKIARPRRYTPSSEARARF